MSKKDRHNAKQRAFLGLLGLILSIYTAGATLKSQAGLTVKVSESTLYTSTEEEDSSLSQLEGNARRCRRRCQYGSRLGGVLNVSGGNEEDERLLPSVDWKCPDTNSFRQPNSRVQYQRALDILEKRCVQGIVVITLTDEDRLNYTYNLIQSWEQMSYVNNWLVICLDKESEEALLANEVPAIHYQDIFPEGSFPPMEWESSTGDGADLIKVKIAGVRFYVLHALLSLGYHVWLTNTEFVWAEDPFPFLRPSKFQLQVLCDGQSSLRIGDASSIHGGGLRFEGSDLVVEVNSAFLFVQSLPLTIELMKDAIHMNEKYFHVQIPNAVALSAALSTPKMYPALKFGCFPKFRFGHACLDGCEKEPVVFHYMCLSSAAARIDKLRSMHLWLLDQPNALTFPWAPSNQTTRFGRG